MLILVFYYLVLPFLSAWMVLRLIRKYGDRQVPGDIARIYREHPIEKGCFRVLSATPSGKAWLGDFETQPEAVDRAYFERERASAGASFLVLNAKGEALEQIDA